MELVGTSVSCLQDLICLETIHLTLVSLVTCPLNGIYAQAKLALLKPAAQLPVSQIFRKTLTCKALKPGGSSSNFTNLFVNK